jgi:hypothetical protein
VLGDAELIVAMQAVDEAGDGHTEIPPDHRAAIDKEAVAALVEGNPGGREGRFPHASSKVWLLTARYGQMC